MTSYGLSPHEKQPNMSDNDMSKASRTNWDRLEQMQDEEIDQTDIPALDERFFARARMYLPNHMNENSVQLESDILTWFKEQEKEYTVLINNVLRTYIESRRK
jgi:uncharacterized protein (DUF4415 family)